MCGRYRAPGEPGRPTGSTVRTDWRELFHQLDLSTADNYNAAPTQTLPVVRLDRDGKPETALLRWGLVPSWAKDDRIAAKLINARGETVAEKPSFRTAFKRQRCLVPMRGFYEWQARTTPQGRPAKLPHYIFVRQASLFAAAGLHERWRDADGNELQTFCIVTTGPNGVTESVHDRMPAILDEPGADTWLDPATPADGLLAVLRPYAAERMDKYPVSSRVGNVRNNDERLVEPLALPVDPPDPPDGDAPVA